MPARHRTSFLARAWPAIAIAGASAAAVYGLDRPTQLTAGDALSNSSPATSNQRVATVPGAVATPLVTSRPPAPTIPLWTSTALRPEPTAPVAGNATACSAAPLDGPVENTRWGPVEVEVVFSAQGTICRADAIQRPGDRSRSVRINAAAVPLLNARAVAAGNATFQSVSGATVTSGGYRQSLQAILDGT